VEDISAVLQTLGRIEGTVTSLAEDQRRVHSYLVAHEARIRAVELAQARMLGWAAGAGALAGSFVAILKGMIL
jgi:hypothetical protein